MLLTLCPVLFPISLKTLIVWYSYNNSKDTLVATYNIHNQKYMTYIYNNLAELGCSLYSLGESCLAVCPVVFFFFLTQNIAVTTMITTTTIKQATTTTAIMIVVLLSLLSLLSSPMKNNHRYKHAPCKHMEIFKGLKYVLCGRQFE